MTQTMASRDGWRMVEDGCYRHSCGHTATWWLGRYSAIAGKTGWYLGDDSRDGKTIYMTLRDAKAAHKCKGGKHE